MNSFGNNKGEFEIILGITRSELLDVTWGIFEGFLELRAIEKTERLIDPKI